MDVWGAMLYFKSNRATVSPLNILVGSLALSAIMLLPNLAVAQFSQASYTTTSRVSQPTSPNLRSLTYSKTKARDAVTYAEDKYLTNSCIEAGRNKTECLCVTRVFKYEMSLNDYKAMAVIFGNKSAKSDQVLSSYGYTKTTVSGLQNLSETISESPDFLSRCLKAKMYYSAEHQH